MKLKHYILLSGIALFSAACYKPGCTDVEATNFDSEAKRMDFSCSYEGNLVFWTTYLKRDDLIALGHDTLYFELDGELVDSIPLAGFASSSGDCNGSGSKTIVQKFDDNFERTFKYRIKGEDYATLQEGFVKIEANDCADVKLE